MSAGWQCSARYTGGDGAAAFVPTTARQVAPSLPDRQCIDKTSCKYNAENPF